MNNLVILIGRLGDKPVTRTLSDGTRVVNLNLATDDSYKDRNGERVQRSTWHRITVWGDKRIDYIETHYGKGDLVQFNGRLSYSQSDREGAKYFNAELTGTTSLLAPVPRETASGSKPKPNSSRGQRGPEPRRDMDDDASF